MPKISRTKEMIELPADFVPGPSHVICAKGKQAKEHKANRLLRYLVQQNVQEYSETASKLERSFIVSKILKTIRQDGGFVRQVSGKWYDVSDRNAREKIGQIFRDQLSWQFKSSTKAKASVRRQRAVTSSISSSSSSGSSVSSSSDDFCQQSLNTPVATTSIPSFFPPTEVSFPPVTPESPIKQKVTMEVDDFEPLPFSAPKMEMNDLEPLPLEQAIVMDFNMSGLTTASDDFFFVNNNNDTDDFCFDQAFDEFQLQF
ncbi:Nitrilase family, member 2 [Seminavis robusta]|uniref:Nitrilase family, member 2 n=1 Tax=Seminavis robusta TaxID=568900 RepID=A0A9N8HJ79_9STRA|nr:Nitrilase family, member 2 [Seminavis robusta]|eukprot:Sro674_g185330.1 Nitrilase family, member 2 (258) ;mRNA; f:4739-5512